MRTLVILNPHAGNAHQRSAVVSALDQWRELGWRIELVETEFAGHAPQLARAAAEHGYDLVVAAGGDGTVNEVVNGLAYTQTALGVLPVGTGNVWVRELRLPLNPAKAAGLIARGTIQTLDLGKAGDRFFLLMAGVGFDAAVTREVLPEAKRRMGVMAYLLKGVALALQYRGTQARVEIDGTRIHSPVLMVLISNSRLYGGYLRIARRASLSDGLLDVCLLKGSSVWSVPGIMAAIMLRRQRLDPVFESYRARQIAVDCTRLLHVQVDGDAIGTTPMLFQSAPQALRALIPTTVSHSQLFDPPPPLAARLRAGAGRLIRRKA